MVDAAQGAGHIPLDVKKDHIDIMAAPDIRGFWDRRARDSSM